MWNHNNEAKTKGRLDLFNSGKKIHRAQLCPSPGKLGETSRQNGPLGEELVKHPVSGVRIPLSPPLNKINALVQLREFFLRQTCLSAGGANRITDSSIGSELFTPWNSWFIGQNDMNRPLCNCPMRQTPRWSQPPLRIEFMDDLSYTNDYRACHATRRWACSSIGTLGRYMYDASRIISSLFLSVSLFTLNGCMTNDAINHAEGI